MKVKPMYIFQSDRLGFRGWAEADLPSMAAINHDPAVMEFFPSIQTEEQTLAFIRRMDALLASKGYCYFAVDDLATQEMIGFIGICNQTFSSDFTPCLDIGWRLGRRFWNQGYATEGAKRCLEFAFGEMGLPKISAFAPEINVKSIRVMEKIGLKKVGALIHPALAGDQRLEIFVCYELERP